MVKKTKKSAKTPDTKVIMRGEDDVVSYRSVPALAAYIDRIGAEQLNFRRFMIKEHRGNYYVERSLIKIDTKTGEVWCSRKEHEPTEAEAETIQAAVLKEKWPTAIAATPAAAEKLTRTLSGDVALFWDSPRKGIVMAQERLDLEEGGKAYLPWSFFSDGKWRRMEPEGNLPFWKSRVKMPKIMVHEGAKAARFTDDLVNNPERREELASHPWGEMLAEYAHWGMIGGALAPHRTDYDELRKEKPTEVVYVCDNDWQGQSALEEVSRTYGGSLKGIRFDERWPPAWDMADQMPKKLYKGRRYVGPQLPELLVPATYATEAVPNPDGKGRPPNVIRRAFKEEWFHAVTPEVFIHKDWPNRILTTPEFNNFVAPFSAADDTSRLLKKDAASKSAVLKYDPGKRPGIYGSGDSGRYINTHCPGDIKPEEGDPAPFLEFMEHLIPGEEDRTELMRWCATLIARPQTKMTYGVLMISDVQGVGKGTLGEKILAPLVGVPNVSYPSENEIVETNFNYWLAHKRLAVVHEIYAGHSAKAYNRLKSLITDRYLTVSKKYMANYEIENYIHVFACSNSMRAIQLSHDDRRWFVPKVNEDSRNGEYWTALNRWLSEEGGLGIIAKWAEDWLEENDAVLAGANAPWSALKREVIEEGYSPGQLVVAGFLDRVADEIKEESFVVANSRPEKADKSWRPCGVMILDQDLVQIIKEALYEGRHSDRLEKPATVRKIAKARGWYEGESKAWLKEWGLSAGFQSRILFSERGMAGLSMEEISGRIRPLETMRLFREWRKM